MTPESLPARPGLNIVAPRHALDGYETVRKLIWIYFWLLIFEGVLRKWVFPGLANVLLLVRAPVVMLCYGAAYRAGRFPKGQFVAVTITLGLISCVFSSFVTPVNDAKKFLIITLFGLHANFLHLPLIFLIRDAFSRERLLAFGKWLMILAPAMAAVVFLQFRAAPDDWINSGAGVGSGQITAAVHGVDKVRPSGLFSYNTGLAAYLSLLTAFVLDHLLGVSRYRRVIVGPAILALMVATLLAISRTTALSVASVFFAGVICMLRIPRLFSRSLVVGVVLAFAAVSVGKFSILGEGLMILQARVEEAEGVKVGLVDRFLDSFAEPFRIIPAAGVFGSGLGLGTNAAGQVMTGQRDFYLGTETEWARHFMEGGVTFGMSYILLRLGLCAYLVSTAIKALGRANPLPFLLLAACLHIILIGPFGVPMTLGFGVFGAGLCLAAAKVNRRIPSNVSR